jgi:hypothetical protein
VLASTGKKALHDGPEDRMERLDYVGLVTSLLAVRAHVEAQVSARAQLSRALASSGRPR